MQLMFNDISRQIFVGSIYVRSKVMTVCMRKYCQTWEYYIAVNAIHWFKLVIQTQNRLAQY